MDIEISHLTRFDYDHEVQLQLHLLYLRPRESALLEVIHLDFSFTPEAKAHWMRDDFDNLPATLQFSSDASHEASVSSKPLPGTTSSNVDGVRFEDLREGQKVSFNEGQGPKGPRAENVRPL